MLRASFTELRPTELVVQVDGKSRELPLGELVRWGSPAARGAQPTVLLRDGSTLVCGPSWTRGSLRLSGEGWTLKNPGLGTVDLPRASVLGVWLGAAGEGTPGAVARAASQSYSGQADSVWLASGDVLAGRLDSIEDNSLTFTTAGEAIPIELSRVEAVALAGSRDLPPPELVLGLEDGSLLYAAKAEWNTSKRSVELAGGESLSLSPRAVCSFLQGFGDRVAYLSDLAPIDYTHTPYLQVEWPLRLDQGLDRERLVATDRRYLKGVAMHSAARAVYRVEGDWQRFAAELAIEDTPAAGSVTFHLLAAKQAGFEPVYDSPVIRAGEAPTPISIDIQGARAIALLVDYADYADRGDHAVWLDARLEK